ncbi:hypothetical protein NQ318_017253 [Aromia moschata]|uniref:DUF5641 domain-containing protein n=1 Tax=Aromia moschata TaxID=1265417 RepID=A0AAV8YN52_9CUCU|nr:hypothetical protein NQ318_017253 [Aromia moschata]
MEKLIRNRASVKSRLTIFSKFVAQLESKFPYRNITDQNFELEIDTRLRRIEKSQIDEIAENLDKFIERESFERDYFASIAKGKLFTQAAQTETQALEQGKRVRGTPKQNTRTKLNPFWTSKPHCTFCKKEHYVQDCHYFSNINLSNRMDHVKRAKLCINCLRLGPMVKEYRSRSCTVCKARHNTLLHMHSTDAIATTQNGDGAPQESVNDMLTVGNSVEEVTTEQPVIDINVYSNLSKLEGIFAYCCAFSSNCRRSATERTFGPLTSKEIKLASLYLIKISQRESFSSEIIAGSRSRPSLVTSFLRPVRFHTINTTHFIIAADPDLTKIPEARPSHFQRIQQLQQYFWNRWSREYISEMQQRNKWALQHGTLKFNDLVLVMEDNQPSVRWALRRIEVLHPGGEGVARVATIRTPTGRRQAVVRKDLSTSRW